MECALSIEEHSKDSMDQWALSLWRGVEENKKKVMNENLETVKNITSGKMTPIMFGSQPSALDEMPAKKRKEIVKYLEKIYGDANLYNPKKQTSKELVDCVIGTYTYE